MLNGGHDEPITLATRITLLRILCVPVFVLLTVYYVESVQSGTPDLHQRWWALAVFVLVAVTDALDGYLARSRGEITKLGTVLDPLADKALMLAALVLLTRPGIPQLHPQFPVWLTVLVISRDVILLAGSWLIHTYCGRLDVKPSLTGKVATALLMFCVIWALAGGAVVWFNRLVIVTGICVAISALQYFWSGFRQLERGGRK